MTDKLISLQYISLSIQNYQLMKAKEKTLDQMSKEELREKEKQMKKQLMKESRELDRQIYKMQLLKKEAQTKLKKQLAKGAKADNFTKKTFARQILQARKNIDRYSTNKAKLKNLEYQIDFFIANIKMTQVVSKAGNIMKDINSKVNIAQTEKAMNQAQEQFMRMGLTQQLIDDALESGNIDDIDIDEEAQKLLHDMEVGVIQKIQKKKQQQIIKPQQDAELDDFQKRLKAI